MIRQACDNDFLNTTDNECAVRIHSLRRAYGINAPFVRFYTDEQGGLLSIMDSTAVLSCHKNEEEWQIFIDMNPDIRYVHCTATFGRRLLSDGDWQGREGVVLQYDGNRAMTSPQVCDQPYLPHVYSLLSTCFDDMPSLNAWYPDVSHRLRHDCSKIATILDGDNVVSTAMTVAETETAAVIGQVATHSDCRGRGYAKACINSLILRCKAKQLYILPMTETAHSIYINMGFVPCDTWAELQRI